MPKIRIKERKKKRFTNLEPSRTPTIVRAGSEPLSQPLNPKLCLLLLHSSQAGGDRSLEDRIKADKHLFRVALNAYATSYSY